MIKLLIFDWDDVITLGAKEGYFACYRKAINAVGVYLSPEEEYKRILAKWGKSFKEELKELLRDKPDSLDEASYVFNKEYWGDTFVNSLKLVEGVNEMLLRLSENYVLAIATGNHPKMLKEYIMPKFHIPNVFSQIISSHDIVDQKKTKPHPFMLEAIIRQQETSAESTLFVGDAISDVQMAFNAHVRPVVVLTGQLDREGAEELGVKTILPQVTDLEKFLLFF